MPETTIDLDIAHAASEWARPDRQLPRWRGHVCYQFPADLWRYAELLWELRPPFVLEVGTAQGGTARFLADVLAAVGVGRLLTIDVQPVILDHPQAMTLCGDAGYGAVIHAVRTWAAGRRGLVLLDGDHASGQVAQELDAYADIADYLVVQDTIMEWLPDYRHDGPHVALARWLPDHPEFAVDPDPVPGPTQHPGGWLRRSKE